MFGTKSHLQVSKIIPFVKPFSEGTIKKLTSNTTWNKTRTVGHGVSLSPRLKPLVFLWTMKLSFVLQALHQMRVQSHARTELILTCYLSESPWIIIFGSERQVGNADENILIHDCASIKLQEEKQWRAE